LVLKIVAPLGCLANPIFPAPVIARFTPGNALADTVMKALSQAAPQQVSAGIGNLRVIAFSGTAEARPWVHMEILEGSYGGRSGLDGMDAVDTLFANTRNNPIEDIESHLPLRVDRYELRHDVVTPGQWRGGIGSVREFTYLVDGGFSIEGDGHKYRPWGFAGGADGKPSELYQVNAAGQATALPSKVPYRRARAGDRLVCLGPSGGGYGDPLQRSAEAVLEDVLDGLLSPANAAEQSRRRRGSGGGAPRSNKRGPSALRSDRAGPFGDQPIVLDAAMLGEIEHRFLVVAADAQVAFRAEDFVVLGARHGDDLARW
jgi:N-methylhydantoinase B